MQQNIDYLFLIKSLITIFSILIASESIIKILKKL